MGSFDSAKMSPHIYKGTFDRILNFRQIGLYRYDGLIFIPNSNCPKTIKLSKFY